MKFMKKHAYIITGTDTASRCIIVDACMHLSSPYAMLSYLRSDICLLVLPCFPEIVLPVAQEHPARVGGEHGVRLRSSDREGTLTASPVYLSLIQWELMIIDLLTHTFIVH